MCISVFSFGQSTQFPFVLISNRDEFLSRESQSAKFHGKDNSVLSGLDLEKGGTWLGITKYGKFGLITNYRNPSLLKDQVRSRGELVLNYLNSNLDPSTYCSQIEKNIDSYNGFNLILGDLKDQSVCYVSNVLMEIKRIDPGLYGVSNAFLDTPWPKVQSLKDQFNTLLLNESMELNELEALLLNTHTYPLEILPNTGVKPELEQALSSVFISLPTYGTVCSSIIQMDSHGLVTFRELIHNHDNSTFVRNQFQFRIQ
ncbi:MAG: NRDE family protein [Bacteroidia bacterium]|nr:NRDE family protein [Bacteroidia bacterium]